MPEDAAIVQRVIAWEKTAFHLLVDRHSPGVMSFARRMLNDVADAEDVVQVALLHAFLNLASLRAPQRFGSWLLGIMLTYVGYVCISAVLMILQTVGLVDGYLLILPRQSYTPHQKQSMQRGSCTISS